MDRILVLGASGLVGEKCLARLPGALGTCHAHPGPGLLRLDKSDPEAVLALFRKHRPAAVVDCAAIADVDACERDPEACRRVNDLGTRNVLEACRGTGAFLLFFSTDYVFPGDREAPYAESDPVRPLNHYGRCKVASERAILGSGVPAAIVRTSVIYGAGGRSRPNFAAWLAGELGAGRRVRGVTDRWSHPTIADDLAEAAAAILDRRVTGLFHVAGPECATRYEFARTLAEVWGFDPGLVEPCRAAELKQAAERPRRVALDLSKARRELGVRCRAMREGLGAMRNLG
ncbi:MAG: SDR family oxidoreductase [Halobacteria archaeon]